MDTQWSDDPYEHVEQLTNTVQQLRAELAAAKAEWLRQIMARDLVIKQLKDAIDRQPYSMDKGVCEAIALQPTTEALDAYVQRAKEEVRDKCAAKCDEAFADNIFTTHDAAIIGMATTKCAAAIKGMEL